VGRPQGRPRPACPPGPRRAYAIRPCATCPLMPPAADRVSHLPAGALHSVDACAPDSPLSATCTGVRLMIAVAKGRVVRRVLPTSYRHLLLTYLVTHWPRVVAVAVLLG